MSSDKISIMIRCDGKSKKILVRKYAQIQELFREVRANIDGAKHADFSLIYHGKMLEELEEGDIISLGMEHLETIDFCIKVVGGGNRSSSSSNNGSIDSDTEEKFQTTSRRPTLPTPSNQTCCIFGDSNEGDSCFKMSCSCVHSTMAIKSYFDVVVNTDKGFSFYCQNCFASWSYEAVRHVLIQSMTEEEFIKMNEKLNDNYASRQLKIRRCPTCKNLIVRDFSKKFLNPYYVKCTICTARRGTAVEFCWCCLKPWNGTSVSSCGNEGCLGKDPRIEFIETCRTKTIGKVSDVPIVRICAKCSALIQHSDKCKHMTCKCGYAFCFICLKPYDNTTRSWQCGKWSDGCPVAPRQTSFFG